MFSPVPPPSRAVPPPRHRVLDQDAAGSAAMMVGQAHPGMPSAREIVTDFEPPEESSFLDDSPAEPVRPQIPIIGAPQAEMSPEDAAIIADILANSRARAAQGPDYGSADGGDGNFEVGDAVDVASFADDE